VDKGEQRKEGTTEREWSWWWCVSTTICDGLILLCDYEYVNLVSYESMWTIDNGIALHVTPRKKFFTTYTYSDFRVLNIGNYSVSKGFSGVC